MKFKSLAVTVLLATSLLGQDVHAADAQTEVKAIITQIQTKLKAGEKTEAQLAGEMKAFDELVAKYKTSAPEDAAQAGFMKALLYLQVFEESEKATAMFTQLQKDFPETKMGKQVPQVLESIKKMAASQAAQSALKVGAQFPDFKETDLNGKPLSISGLKGKVVLVDFWATWCGPCIGELPHVKKAYDKHHKDGFEVVGVSLDREKDQLTGFIAKEKMTWPQFFDEKGKLATQYGISAIPATFLLDKDGKILAKGLRGDSLEQAVAKALGK